ncbi:MAG TPA: ComF family protein [Bryocella sp.]|nr:ComF family protein [Bryocella sp.]
MAQLVFLHAVPRVRSVFSVSVEDVRLENGGPPGRQAGVETSSAGSWRAVTRVLRSCKAAVGGAVVDVVNAVWPGDCRLCGGPMISISRAGVCESCVASVKPQDQLAEQSNVLCSRCGDALGMESARFAAAMGTTECTMCRLAAPEFVRAVAYAEYDAEVREMLHLLKFNGVREVAAHLLGDYLAQAVLKLEDQAARELVVIPVPLFAARERSRGFNQSKLLADSALKRLRTLRRGWKLQLDTKSFARVKDTHALFTMQPHERRKSLRGAFRVMDAEAIRGREVLLIDDIMTTGATARECARVLLRAGAAKVWVATVAKAQPESVRVPRADRFGEEMVARWDGVPVQSAEAQASW